MEVLIHKNSFCFDSFAFFFCFFWPLVFLLPQLPPPAPPSPIPSVLSAHFQSSKFPTERIAYCLSEMRTVTSKILVFRGLKKGVRIRWVSVCVCTSVCISVNSVECWWLKIASGFFCSLVHYWYKSSLADVLCWLWCIDMLENRKTKTKSVLLSFLSLLYAIPCWYGEVSEDMRQRWDGRK